MELDTACQKIEEPIKAWYGRILELHARAHPEISDADWLVFWPLIQIFLSGLTSQITRDAILHSGQNPRTMSEAYERAESSDVGQTVTQQTTARGGRIH